MPSRTSLRVVFAALLLGLVVALISMGVWVYVAGNKPGRADIDVEERTREGPLNVLLLGSDSREGLSPEELKKYDPKGVDRRTGRRADTIMLLHLPSDRRKAVLVSFPRDLKVDYPNGGSGRINASYQKGPSNVIATVQGFTGVPIHHYVEVNFSSFKKIVDTLGGIDVYFERSVNEKDSGLNVPKGCVHLEGDQALAFVRVRKVDSDFGRIARQQLFLRLMLEKVLSAGTLLNPNKLVKLTNLVSSNVTTDQELSPTDAVSLGRQIKDFDSSKVDMRVVPSSTKNIGGISYVVANTKQTAPLFQAIRYGSPLPDYGRTGVSPLDPSDVRLTVLDGAGSGKARSVSEELLAAGFAVEATGSASRHPRTLVYFKEGNEEKASLVAARFGAKTKLMPQSLQVDTEVALVLGEEQAAGSSPSPSVSSKPSTSKPSPGPTNTPKPLARRCDA